MRNRPLRRIVRAEAAARTEGGRSHGIGTDRTTGARIAMTKTSPGPAAPVGALAVKLALGVLATAFCVLAWPRRWFNDDAFITFRYARNLAEGHGFVWNVVDPVPVEGSTSLGWTLISTLFHAVGIDPVTGCQALGLVAALFGLWLAWRTARTLGGPAAWALAAPALLVAHRQYVLWSVSAMETRVATVIALGATLLLVRETASPDGSRPWSGLAYLLGTIVRPETPLLHAAAGFGILAARPSRATLQRVALSGAVHGAGLGLLTAWRLVTFGRPLPNPFYVKVGGLQWSRGVEWMGQFLGQYHAVLWALPLMVAAFVLVAHRDRLGAALVAQILAVSTWVVAIGGGRWEFRFLDWLWPSTAALIAFGLFRLGTPAGSDPRRALGRRLLAAGLAASIVASQGSTLFRPFRRFDQMMSIELLHSAARVMLTDGRKLAEFLGPEDRIATGWAGAIPYATGAWHFDPWGLNHPDGGTWPFERTGVLFHQRHATWRMLADADVMFVDIFNQFLHRRPLSPAALVHALRPWAHPGSLVYCVELPGRRAPWYFVFASPRPREEIDRWIERHGLRLAYALPLNVPAAPVLGEGDAPRSGGGHGNGSRLRPGEKWR